MDGDAVYFCTDSQCVSLHPRGMDPGMVAPTAPKMLKLIQGTMIFIAVTLVSSLVALFVGALQPRNPTSEDHPSFQDFQVMFPGDNTTEPVEPNGHYYFGRVQEAIQIFKSHMENSSTQHVEIQMLKCRVENVSSQIQVLEVYLGNTSADIQKVRSALQEARALSLQTEMLGNSLQGASAEIQRLKGDLEKANALTLQAQDFFKNSSENTSVELHMLSRGLENANSEIQLLKAGLEIANTQASLANSSLKNANADINTLRGHLDSVNDLRTQNQVLRGSLEGAQADIQKLRGSLQNTNALNSQTQTLLKGSLDNTSAEILMLRGHLERTGNEMQKLKEDVENTKILTSKIQEEQSQLGTLHAAIASLEQLQTTQNQLLQLLLQGWKVYGGNLYYFSHVKKPWHEAEQFCVSQGAHLASVTSQEEQAFLVQFSSTSYHWIGLTDRGTEGSWRWTDGTPFNNARSKGFWDKNQPDNWRHGNGQYEDCVHIQKKWNDINCSNSYQWVCKKKTGSAVA
ncbi:C-type lectin domain family 4 member F [Fukomys damarensis]|nr:C-type lectin domain family 4 member F [Fukomys damarensis]XP_010607948.1 C-type lectin domain family 4 member F [Fukomys damarensis]